MSIIILILQVIIIIGTFWLVEYIKQVPEQVHKKNLETFKNELQKEIVKLEASESNLHLKKIEKFTEFTEIFQTTLSGIKYNEKEQKVIEESTIRAMESFTKDIIFFAGEKTLDKFVEYRRYSRIARDGGINEKIKFQFIMAELILEMRKDLGFKDGITVDHYMHILINDWDNHKDEYRAKAKQAKQLNE